MILADLKQNIRNLSTLMNYYVKVYELDVIQKSKELAEEDREKELERIRFDRDVNLLDHWLAVLAESKDQLSKIPEIKVPYILLKIC